MNGINNVGAVTVKGIDLGHLLNALVQLRWTVEDAAPENAPEVLHAIGTVETTLLTNEGRLSHEQRDSFLEMLRASDAAPAEGHVDLVDRIAGLLLA